MADEPMWPNSWEKRALAAEERVKALDAKIERLCKAIMPFSEFAIWTDEHGWTSTIHREGISVWFGPSDFREAADAMSASQ